MTSNRGKNNRKALISTLNSDCLIWEAVFNMGPLNRSFTVSIRAKGGLHTERHIMFRIKS